MPDGDFLPIFVPPVMAETMASASLDAANFTVTDFEPAGMAAS